MSIMDFEKAVSGSKGDFVSATEQSTLGCQNDELRPKDPPDGGITAWLHLLLMHIVFFNTWGVANGYGAFQEYYAQIV